MSSLLACLDLDLCFQDFHVIMETTVILSDGWQEATTVVGLSLSDCALQGTQL
jgi:hypothetical protein